MPCCGCCSPNGLKFMAGFWKGFGCGVAAGATGAFSMKNRSLFMPDARGVAWCSV